MNDLVFFENRISMPAGSELSVRSTLVTLNSGYKILISPINFTPEQLEQLKTFKPNAIVAPNCYHHLFVNKAAEDLQIQSIYGACGLQKKRPDINWTAIIDDKTWSFGNELQCLQIAGAPKYNECVFYHSASKTLIVTDLLFNLKNLDNSFGNFIYKIFGTHNQPAVSRLLKILTTDKKALQTSIHKILELDFEKIVVAHGELITENAKQILKTAFESRGLI